MAMSGASGPAATVIAAPIPLSAFVVRSIMPGSVSKNCSMPLKICAPGSFVGSSSSRTCPSEVLSFVNAFVSANRSIASSGISLRCVKRADTESAIAVPAPPRSFPVLCVIDSYRLLSVVSIGILPASSCFSTPWSPRPVSADSSFMNSPFWMPKGTSARPSIRPLVMIR
jgi:hypothetical protein